MEGIPKEPNPWWLRGTAIVMGLMFLLSVGQVASSLLIPLSMERLGSTEWEDLAGEYPSEGNEREQDEWREGEVFWDESIDYWESIIESGIFEQHQKSGAKLILVIADEELRLKRALHRGDLKKETIKNRIRLQMKDDEKSKYSDYVVENNSSELELFSKIDQIITKII